MNKKQLTIPLAALALVLSAGGGFVAAAHADTTTATAATTQTADQTHTPPAAVGTVTAINGNTITLSDKKSGTTYTVDASSATVTKHTAPTTTSGTTPTAPVSTTISVSDIAVGDTVMVQGTVSGTTITATKVDDGQFGGMRGPSGRGPGVQGTVTAINGNTITITDKDGKTYTIDGSSSTVSKMETISVSDIAVGDTVGAQGTVSGTVVAATHIMDGMPAK